MKKTLIPFLFFTFIIINCKSQNIYFNEPIIPILNNIENNILSEFVIENNEDSVYLTNLKITLIGDLLKDIKYVKLFYSGNTSVIRTKTTSNTLLTDYNIYGSSTKIYADCNFSQLISTVDLKSFSGLMTKMDKISNAKSGDIILTIKANKLLSKGENYFWFGIDINESADLLSTLEFEIKSIKINDKLSDFKYSSTKRRVGHGLRNSNDDGAFAYRIPGLETTKSGKLIAIYDIRHDNAGDLQGNIDVGMSVSTDKGQSWSKMKPILDMGEFGGLPNAQNGVGDAAILYDKSTNRLWVAALWIHGLNGKSAWGNSKSGLEPSQTGQLVLIYSDDEGETWSDPINLTKNVKDKSWRLFFNGPGKGIVMQNGTLVFACQHIDANGVPYSGILFSTDKGKTWEAKHTNYSNTTEAQVVEIEPNVLMLNMRDNRGKSRAVFTTDNMGETWTKHPSSNKLLQDPVCMASLIKIPSSKNILEKDILIFSNPNNEDNRKDITLKISYDNGNTWSNKSILLDSEYGWGYSCLTPIDDSTIGIIYEGSTSHLVFQRISLIDFQ